MRESKADRLNWIYILTNIHRTVFYTGSTADIVGRMREHENGDVAFTAKYNCTRLVWFEEAGNMDNALAREHRVKRWKRDYKVALIEAKNPEWNDLRHLLAA